MGGAKIETEKGALRLFSFWVALASKLSREATIM